MLEYYKYNEARGNRYNKRWKCNFFPQSLSKKNEQEDILVKT